MEIIQDTKENPKQNIDCYSIPCFGNAIVNAKDIYTDYLLSILTPLLYEGFKSMYNKALNYEQGFKEAAKKNIGIQNYDVITIFRSFVLKTPDMNNNQIEQETKRIRNHSGCADYFDDLIRSVIKSHISILTCTIKNSSSIGTKFHETVNVDNFIHKCYIESSREIYDNPLLFNHNLNQNKIKDNQQTAFQIIKTGIKNAIRQTLPMKQIIPEYLSTDVEEISQQYAEKIKAMIMQDIHNVFPQGMQNKKQEVNLLEDSNHNALNTDKDDFGLEDFIFNRKRDETINETVIQPPQIFMNKPVLLQADSKISLNPTPKPISEHKTPHADPNKEMSSAKLEKTSEKKPEINNGAILDEVFLGKKGGASTLMNKIQAINEKKNLEKSEKIVEKVVEKSVDKDEKNKLDGLNIVRNLKDVKNLGDNHFSEVTTNQ